MIEPIGTALNSDLLLFALHLMLDGIVVEALETLAEGACELELTRQVMQQSSTLGRKAVARKQS
jgi:hypothetical protein